MKRAALSLVLVALPFSACVSKGTYTSVAAQLAECRKDKTAAQDTAKSCQERYDRDAKLWEEVGSSVTDVVPKALQEFQEERAAIVEKVPEQVREEVDRYLDQFATAISKSFSILRKDNERLINEVQTNREQLKAVGMKAEAIDTKVGKRMEAADEARDRMVKEANALIEEVQEWDRSYVNDKNSESKLGLSRKERETITLFHNQLVARLNHISTESQAPAPVANDGAAAPAEETTEAPGSES